MKQLLQNLATGATELVDIPVPVVGDHEVLIKTKATVISSGTERMLVEFGKSNLIAKAKSQPDRVKQVIDKVFTDGFFATIEAVRAKIDQPLALGYCNAGEVIKVGKSVTKFKLGDRVASNGKHAEIVVVPETLCALIPSNVEDQQAAFTPLAAIALQSIRLADVKIGETVAVIGLGLIGLITVELLRAQGCRVLGIDIDQDRLNIAAQFGAIICNSIDEDVNTVAHSLTHQIGCDAVIITASSSSNEIISLAAKISRKRGRVILVGVIGLQLSRADFYEKELVFQVSCSYGPGRYDAQYETEGQDYPIGFVRWTAQRNFEAILSLLQDGKISMAAVTSHSFKIDDFQSAYDLILSKNSSLGVVLNYDPTKKIDLHQPVEIVPIDHTIKSTGKSLAIIGAGNYSRRILSKSFKLSKAHLKYISSASGVSAYDVAKKTGANYAVSGTERLFNDQELDIVVIATRHDSHAQLVQQSYAAGKHVFVEKPLALTLAELDTIQNLAKEHANIRLMVGFNRRFSIFSQTVKRLLVKESLPKSFIFTINAGKIPHHHWTQDLSIGGGRIIGEACHFIDLMRFFAGCAIVNISTSAMQLENDRTELFDTVSINLNFADGSHGTIHYFANGHPAIAKERYEIFCNGKYLLLDNFRRLTGRGWRGFKRLRKWRQDKGQNACVAAFINSIEMGSDSPIPFAELYEVSRATIIADQMVRNRQNL